MINIGIQPALHDVDQAGKRVSTKKEREKLVEALFRKNTQSEIVLIKHKFVIILYLNATKNMYPANPTFARTHVTHPNNIMYLSPDAWKHCQYAAILSLGC